MEKNYNSGGNFFYRQLDQLWKKFFCRKILHFESSYASFFPLYKKYFPFFTGPNLVIKNIFNVYKDNQIFLKMLLNLTIIQKMPYKIKYFLQRRKFLFTAKLNKILNIYIEEIKLIFFFHFVLGHILIFRLFEKKKYFNYNVITFCHKMVQILRL